MEIETTLLQEMEIEEETEIEITKLRVLEEETIFQMKTDLITKEVEEEEILEMIEEEEIDSREMKMETIQANIQEDQEDLCLTRNSKFLLDLQVKLHTLQNRPKTIFL